MPKPKRTTSSEHSVIITRGGIGAKRTQPPTPEEMQDATASAYTAHEKVIARKSVQSTSKTLHGNAAEKKLAKRLGGKATIASGALEFAKGDIVMDSFLVESKSTLSDSLGVKIDWLAKINQEALEKGRKPALAVQFVTGSGSVVKNGSWVLIKESDFLDYCAYLKEE